MFNKQTTCSYSLLCTLGRVPEESDFDMFRAVYTKPTSPDYVFLVLYIIDHNKSSAGIYRHGNTEWSITKFERGTSGVIPFVRDVFIRGVFYFLCMDYRLGSYDIRSKEIKLDSFAATIDYRAIQKFFALDEELILAYYEVKPRRFLITSYDWSQKLWVPLRNLGDRSLFFSSHSVYVDAINYYGVSANKIYIRQDVLCLFLGQWPTVGNYFIRTEKLEWSRLL